MRKTDLLSRATRSPLRPTLCVPDTWLQEAGWCAFLLLAASPQSPTQTSAGCTLSSPGPAPHATQTQFIPRFPFPPGLGGLLSEVSEITVSVMAQWGGRWLITTPSAGAAPAWWPAELLGQDQCPVGTAPSGRQQTQLSIFLAWCKLGSLLSHGSSIVQCM